MDADPRRQCDKHTLKDIKKICLWASMQAKENGEGRSERARFRTRCPLDGATILHVMISNTLSKKTNARHFYFSILAVAVHRNGLDINARDIFGMTPLHWAALFKKKDACDVLIETIMSPIGGIPLHVNAVSKAGETPLMVAIPSAPIEIIKRLIIYQSPKTLAIKNKLGQTVQEIAVKHGRTDVLDFLAEAPGNLHYTDYNDDEPRPTIDPQYPPID